MRSFSLDKLDMLEKAPQLLSSQPSREANRSDTTELEAYNASEAEGC